MRTNDESRFSLLLIGLGLGAIGALVAALLARKETRQSLRERSTEALDYLSQQTNKLREATEAIVDKGKELLSHGRGSVDAATQTQEKVEKQERRETLGG